MPEAILHIEDDRNDQFLVERALKKLASPVEVRAVSDGDEAIDYFKGNGKFSDRKSFPLPTVVFLDIKLPRKTGHEVLEWLKNDPILKRIPVVMISGSAMQSDIDRAYELGASAYLVKPVSGEELQALFKLTGEFFLEHVEKPSFKVHPA